MPQAIHHAQARIASGRQRAVDEALLFPTAACRFMRLLFDGRNQEGGVMRMFRLSSLIVILVLVGAFATTADEEKSMGQQVKDSIQLFKKDSTNVAKLFDTSYAYAVLPSVGKGGAGIGGAHGEGQVFEKGKLIGTCEMTQFTIGLELGGQKFDEVIFFESKDALDPFRGGEWGMSAGVNAVAAASSASADAKYKNGVMVFTISKGGLMVEASVGGQKFKFTPLDKN
jgi:lipid-binding SYLF domain-containing protein